MSVTVTLAVGGPDQLAAGADFEIDAMAREDGDWDDCEPTL